MKEVTVICPKCGIHITFKNWFVWIWKTPFHYFNKRKVKCPGCGMRSYVRRQ